MDKISYLPLAVCIAFCAILIAVNAIADNPLDDSDMNGINASIWQDLPLESDDKSPIVLIAKPFTHLNGTSTNATGGVNLNQTADFFAATAGTAAAAVNQVHIPGPIERPTKNLSTPLESSFTNHKFASFRKKFFSRLIPL